MSDLIRSLSQQEQLNFLLTNRIPRRMITRLVARFSQIENRQLTKVVLSIWQRFTDDLQLDEAKKAEFTSLHDCFTRELKVGARPIDTRKSIVVSPCDAIIGSHGDIQGTTAYQAKGFPYDLNDLMADHTLQEKYSDGKYITLRLKSSMYHRFHAPADCEISNIIYISGDTWNVNPIALKRIEKLYCKNERAVLPLHTTAENSGICLVAVAAILVASISLRCIDDNLSMEYKGPNNILCNAKYRKGDELGYFQHGSTIILFATADHTFLPHIKYGQRINMGQPLLSLASHLT